MSQAGQVWPGGPVRVNPLLRISANYSCEQQGISRVLSYDLSVQNRIVGLDGDWDRQSQGMGQAVMGRPIWDFVVGLDTRSYLNALLFAARRAGDVIAVRYRCDTPSERRLYRMEIAPLEGGGLRVHHLPLEISPNEVPPRPEPPGACCCSQCLCWQRDGVWGELPALPSVRAPVDYRICPNCRAAAQHSIDAALGGGHMGPRAYSSPQTGPL